MAATPHSEFRDIVNTICMQVGLPTITDDAKFNSLSGLMRPHVQLIKFVDDADAKLVLRLSEIFTTRRFETSTQVNVKELEIDALADIEGIKYHSFRCNSSGGFSRLNFIPYNIYREMQPDLDKLDTGRPRSWTYFEQPQGDGVDQTTRQVVLYPVPDDAYKIEYMAKVNHKPLKLADDKILWPPQYEHVLIAFGRDMLEQKMGIGNQTVYAQAALDNVKQWASGPLDRQTKVSFGGLSIGANETSWDVGNIGYDWSNG